MSKLTKNQHEELLDKIADYISSNTKLEREAIYQTVDDQLTILEYKLQEAFESKL